MTLLNKILPSLGLMTVEAHEAVKKSAEADQQALRRMKIGRDDWRQAAKHWEAKFKKAITEVAAQADEIAARKDAIAVLKEMVARDTETIASLRPDAEAMRRKRQMDRDRKAAKAGVVS